MKNIQSRVSTIAFKTGMKQDAFFYVCTYENEQVISIDCFAPLKITAFPQNVASDYHKKILPDWFSKHIEPDTILWNLGYEAYVSLFERKELNEKA
jgi:hypothetical protein